ncbi:MAG TPA: CapA family protein [Anaerolineales bacterium]|nr:CapA family protein [Anaerolineales bacterium]
MRGIRFVMLTVLIAAGLGAGCNAPATDSIFDPNQAASPAATPTLTPFQPLPASGLSASPIPTLAAPEANPTPAPVSPGVKLTIWVAENLPASLHQAVMIPPGFEDSAVPESADLRLEVGAGNVISAWVYALVAPFPSVVQGVPSEALRLSWAGQPAGPFENRPLLVDQSTASVFTALWGEPAGGAIQVLPEGELLAYAWEHQPAWALLPFEKLEPRWKVLEVDEQSPLRKDFDPASYPLTVPISLSGEAKLVELVKVLYGPASAARLAPPGNRAPEKLTTLALTGVTALVRATAYAMENQGITYPGRDVRDWLREADITHISNEVPFARNCPFPNPVQESMRFCSDPRYIELLEDIGTDVVELTGDHFQDWGAEAMLYTLELYHQRGWGYYGGGENLQTGRQALTLEHNGNKLAFLGCNGKGRAFAQAGPNNPGAVVCDFDWLEAEISRLRQAGYLPVVTFQHLEYYSYQAMPLQKRDFIRAAQAGAAIVSGSQAHQPQAFEFLEGTLIHYGLGNMFFDQFGVSQATRQAFIDRHVFYAGRHISTELLPILFVDYARPRPMTPAERQELLQAVFAASGW